MATPEEQQMSKRAKMTVPETQTTMMGSILKLRVNYEETKVLPIGKAVYSDVVSAVGRLWMVCCYPRGQSEADKGEYLSIFLRHMSSSGSAKAIFEASLSGKDGQPSKTRKSGINVFSVDGTTNNSWGWPKFVQQTDLEKKYITKGQLTFVCTITVIHDCHVSVPPSNIGIHLGRLLDNKDGADVSFTIKGEMFSAHRAVLAARSPVFKAELFGSMAEASMPSIPLHDIAPATFIAMLRFMYTDAMPGDKELGDNPVDMLQDLLAAANRYALDRLKLMCVQRLWDSVSTDTVATILVCAETYGCPELKNKCFDFCAVDNNFKKAAFTNEYAMLVLKYPSIAAELCKRVIS